jgi:alpha-1,2-mannosyltransferase
VKNLLLNMNVLSVLAVLGALKAGQIVLREGFLSNPHTLSVLSAFPWLCVMFSMPHKEQRFLYPVYPLLALGAASLFRQAKRGRLLALIVIAISLLATSSRIAALENRRGTMKLWFAAQPLRNATICLGDEWYRFPSSFWLPDESVRVEYVTRKEHFPPPPP